MASAVFSLNVHANWACRHSGACCRAGWHIPVEAHAKEVLGTEWLAPDASGACPQFDARTSLCRVHRDHGEATLPRSCHHFPRRALIDGRGTFVSLSHFCPTAASLLVDSREPLRIVEHPAAFPASRGYEGLNAQGEWPPLLRPTVLFDDESFAGWERYLVETLDGWDGDIDSALLQVACAAERLRAWTPDRGTLEAWTEQTLAGGARVDRAVADRYAPVSGSDAFNRVLDAIPAGLPRPSRTSSPTSPRHRERFETGWQRHSAIVLRYLGAKAFASWTAYQSRGVRTQIAELYVTAAILRVECLHACDENRALDRDAFVEAVRGADWLLVHLVDRSRLMAWLGSVER
jgi:hypothetical protein